jgi:hypothetical protein
MATQVYLHIGQPKTGTTYLQSILWGNRETLKAAGLLLPTTPTGQIHAVVDTVGDPDRSGFPAARVEGAWKRLLDETHAWPGRALVSRESMVSAGPQRIHRIVRDLAPAEVHVIITVRDLARAIPAFWQQTVKVGRTHSLDAYVRSIIDGTEATRGFQHAQFTDLVVQRWAQHVPADRIHVVTVPPPGSPPGTIWQRFAEVLDIGDVPLPDASPVPANPSLGAVEIELLRRTNERLTPRLQGRQRTYWTRQVLANKVLGGRKGDRFALPSFAHDWAVERAEQTIRSLEAVGCDVHGDLDDLRPVKAGSTVPGPDQVSDRELVEAAADTIAELVIQLRDSSFAARRARAKARRRRRRVRPAQARRSLMHRVRSRLRR